MSQDFYVKLVDGGLIYRYRRSQPNAQSLADSLSRRSGGPKKFATWVATGALEPTEE